MKYPIVKFIACLFLVLTYTNLFAATTNNACKIELIVNGQVTATEQLTLNVDSQQLMPSGSNKLKLTCSLIEQSVFGFNKDEILDVIWDKNSSNILQLPASHPSYLLPSGNFSVLFTIDTHTKSMQQIYWQDVAIYLNDSLVNNTTMGAFYGLCLTLILYVFFMGRTLNDNRFQLYSVYVFCAATFFLLQEGQLNIVLPNHSFLLSHQLYLIFAGLTVFSATVFIVRLTDLHLTWPKTSHYFLTPSAALALAFSVIIPFLEHNAIGSFFSQLMAWLTLLIMLVILLLIAIQSFRKVAIARLVFLSLLLMVAAMVFRIAFHDFNPFLTRYALIIAFAIEAFIFAIAVSSRVKNINLQKIKAEKDANTDALCKVYNRRGWDVKANALLTQHKQGAGILSLLYIDINDFKIINDTHGHDSGDKALIIISKIIKKQVRENDIVGRIGGDEFVIVGLFENEKQANNLAHRIKTRLSSLTLRIQGAADISASASVGQVKFSTSPASVTAMLDLADKSMYQAKREKKNERQGNLQID
ncbi:diguanylate cyclase [Paraglaciecola aquimarina]|uniref:diguanylate cyclase n=1 Tax=Paraglaciecola aquimarina TaxID=1235557 RepID=A0ABU3T196_9ALTE|nr:diguanylate cyclase [Paraglaciecola aquimarina]MDU0356046.1 diguanylate cyclase [Paraglaciecola aquimarina]